MHADMTSVTIQSNKIVLNEVKDNEALLEPPYRKNVLDFFVNPIFSGIDACHTGYRKSGRF